MLDKTMKILLLGANGRTGREVLTRGLAAGHSVTALVRSEDRLTDVEHPRLEITVGDVCDASLLEALLLGNEVVISALGPRRPTKASSAIYPESAAAIVEAMHRSSATRLVVTSSALLFQDQGWMNRMLRFLVPRIVEGARRRVLLELLRLLAELQPDDGSELAPGGSGTHQSGAPNEAHGDVGFAR